MLLLIDAYNLLHQSDALQRRRDAGWLHRARERLLLSLSQHLPPDLATETCLVFDAAAPPAYLPHEYVQHQIHVLYAVNHAEADDLLEELIARHATPKRLTVVSSDHRVQRAASRRGAAFFDADVWYADLLDRGPRLAIPWPPQPSTETTAQPAEKQELELSPAELDAWLAEFSKSKPQDSSLANKRIARNPKPQLAQPTSTDSAAAKPPPRTPRSSPTRRTPPAVMSPIPKQTKSSTQSPPRPPDLDKGSPKPGTEIDGSIANPFPPGYGEDLL